VSADEQPARVDPEVLHEIVLGTSAETGEAFFAELVKHLARALGTKCAWVTEWLAERRRLRALSFWVEGGYFGDYEYDIANTPCETVITERRLVHVPDRLLELYAGDPDLKPLGAVSYLGVPLLDTGGQILGHLGVLHDKPLPEDPRAMAVFNIFKGRAAAELRRIRRDQELRDREKELSLLIDSARDAIVELDGELRLARMNRAARETFKCDTTEAIGNAFASFLTEECRDKLLHLAGRLGEEPRGRQSLWIPGGIEAVDSRGAVFPVEATLSRFELDGRPFYTLILRNVNELAEAEERIRSLMDETEYLRAEINALEGRADIIGESEALRRVLSDVERVAAGDTTVLVTGETGTGKELIARAVHQRSPRAGKPLIKVNCAAIHANLQESEFFGHEKGAFTGATRRREGRFKLADGGTIFLDEVGEMPLELQAKLLRVLQEGEFEPVGASRSEKIDVRVIAATNKDLEAMVEAGAFRRDLLYRLNVFPIHAPPLRERGDDVVLLAEAFARRLAAERGRSVRPLAESARARLKAYGWPGNVRELENVIERAFITSTDGRTLNLERALPEAGGRTEPQGAGGAAARLGAEPAGGGSRVFTAKEMEELERTNLIRALERSAWKVSGAGGAAEALGLSPSTLASRMKSLGVARPARSRPR
jgi:PAS domain S-box-containing protein